MITTFNEKDKMVRMTIEISSDPDRLNVDLIHRWLSKESYWAQGRTLEAIRATIANSICFGIYLDGEQVGFARVVSDRVTFAWLADVFIDEAHRGHGYGKSLVAAALAHPELREVRRWLLATRDAHGLYAQYGFAPVPIGRFMDRVNPDPRSATPDRT